jgi:hypothetical protein
MLCRTAVLSGRDTYDVGGAERRTDAFFYYWHTTCNGAFNLNLTAMGKSHTPNGATFIIDTLPATERIKFFSLLL